MGLDKLSVALAVTVISGALGLVAIFITRATLTEAYIIAIALILVALYVLWRIEFSASYNFRTGRTPVKVELDSANSS
jgi:hypothetical protein